MAGKRGRPKKVKAEGITLDAISDFESEDMDPIDEVIEKGNILKGSEVKKEPSMSFNFPSFDNSPFDKRNTATGIVIAMLRNKNKAEDYVLEDALKWTDKIFSKYPNVS